MRVNRGFLFAFALASIAAGSAHSQTTPSPEQAQNLERQLSDWLGKATAGAMPIPARPVQMTAEGDHYLVRVPLSEFGLGKLTPPDAAFTAKAKPLGGTRWALDEQRFPADVSFTARQPVVDTQVPAGRPPKMEQQEVSYHVTLGSQTASSVIDTSYETPANGSGTFTALDWTNTSSAGATATHFSHLTSTTSTRPTDPAHADLVLDGTGDGYFTKFETPDGNGSSFSADLLHTTATISGLAHDKLLPLVTSSFQMANMAKASGRDPSAPPTPAEKQKLHDLLASAMGLLTGARFEQSFQGVKFDSSGVTGAIKRLEVAMGGQAPAKLLGGDFGFTMDGLTVDSLPPQLASYVPSLVALHATVSNVNGAALTKLGEDASAPPAPGKPGPDKGPDFSQIFANGGIVFAFDRLAIDLAGAQFRGTGSFTATSPQVVSGQADITAHGLDDLIAQAQANPALQAGIPVVIFLKGIAKVTGDQALWQVTLAKGKALVNGVDLSAMLGGGGKSSP